MKPEPQHVIVIGAARSGTKFVRDLIGHSHACATVPYDINYVWRTGNEGLPHDLLEPSHLTPKRSRQIAKSLVKLSGWKQSPEATMIVEKTVSNCLRIPFIDAALPDVKYINLLRDGRDVVESSYRMWHEPADRGYLLKKLRYVPLSNAKYLVWYAANMVKGKLSGRQGVNLWGVRYPGIQQDLAKLSVAEVCAHQWVKCVEQTQQDLQTIPADRQLTIRHEDLVADESQIHRVAEFLELPDTDRLVANYNRKRRVIPPGAWSDRFDDATWKKVLEIISPTLASLDYERLERTV